VWVSVASSADGQTLAVSGLALSIHAMDPSPLDMSMNAGATWTVGTFGYGGWSSVCCSADGQKLAAVLDVDLYTSTNAGAAWSSNSLPDIPVGARCYLAYSADGSKLVAAAADAGIYVWQTPPTPVLKIVRSGQNLRISWIVPSLDFVLQQNSDLTTAGWTDVTVKPALNYTNLHYEVSVPPPTGTVFYRLTHY
jgi:hypothetical protein